MKKLLILFTLLLATTTFFAESAARDINASSGKAQNLAYRVVKSYPHDSRAFTQGLVIENGVMYEGTGRYGSSSVRKVDLATGEVLQVYSLPQQFFGEGITLYGNKIIQLTWKSRIGFVFDKNNFKLLRLFTYPAEGWGITHDGRYLITSDGTSNLYFLDPETFEEKKKITVTDRDVAVTKLNELEYVKGKVYANVWQTDRIAIIDPETGRVTGWIDLSGLFAKEEHSEKIDVLNGIAYDKLNNSLFVTGKLWPRLFQLELIEKSGK